MYVVQVQSPTFSTLSEKRQPWRLMTQYRTTPTFRPLHPSKIWWLVTIPSSITTCTYFTAHWTSRCTNEAVFATYARVYSFIAFIWCTKRVYVHRIRASFSPPTQYHASSIHHSNGGCYLLYANSWIRGYKRSALLPSKTKNIDHKYRYLHTIIIILYVVPPR